MHARIVTLALGLLAAAAAQAAQPLRYVALLANGERIEGDRLSNWHDPNGLPHLSGKQLLSQDNPFRWLRDRAHELADVPPAYIEFHNGDRLPGTVIDYRTGLENPYDPKPPHFVVRVAVNFEPPENRPVAEIRVVAAWARRIVWQRRGSAAQQPGAALFRDGRTLAYRAVRFHTGESHLLMADGDEHVPWSDLAELHLPVVDPWTAHFDELAALCTTANTRLIEIETSAGLMATASLARLSPRFEGNSSDADRWAHGVQPAWSLDMLWIPFREVAFYRTFAPREVPLSRITPRQVVQRGGLGGKSRAERNRSVMGTPLGSQSLDFGFGWGVWGGSELTFDLPTGVRSLRCWVGIDRAATGGGCIRPRIFANDTRGRPLWEGPILVGSSPIADTGVIGLGGPAAGQQSIVLQVDPVISGRPAGADPFDIRDYGDWCDPLLELDPTMVQAQLERRLPRRFAAWRDWQVHVAGGGTPAEAGLETTFHFDPRRPPGEIEAAIQVKQRPLILSRELSVGPRDQWLLIAATRPINRGKEPKLEVRIGGEAVAEFTVPERQHDPNDNRPLAVSLAPYAANPPRKIRVEIQQAAVADSAPVHYRALAVVEQLPTLFRVFEEQGQPAAIEPGQSGSAAVIEGDRHHGQRSLRVTPAGRFRLTLPAPVAIRERPGWGEARFLRFAVKKQGGGRVAIELEDAQFREQAARYDLGPGQPAYGAATRIWQDNLPKDWVVLTRDLFADFGNLDVRALIVGAPDGEAVLIDHVYLARNQSDFDQIPAASPAQVNDKAVQEMIRPFSQRAIAATVQIEFADGRKSAGAVFEERGEILTAGHAVIGPGRDCRVTFADGKTAAARTLGVAREFDLGLVRITPDGSYPRLEPHGPSELPQNQTYIAILSGQPHVTQLRRVFRSTAWTDLEPTEWIAGGPLLDRDGRLIGVQVAKSRFGGVLCTRLSEAWNQLGRLRNNEVFGAWPAGSEPLTGCEGAIEDNRFHLTGVATGGPAATAGLATGDEIIKLDGRPIAGPDDWQRAIAERDPGQEVTIDYVRSGQPRQAKLKLARVPLTWGGPLAGPE